MPLLSAKTPQQIAAPDLLLITRLPKSSQSLLFGIYVSRIVRNKNRLKNSERVSVLDEFSSLAVRARLREVVLRGDENMKRRWVFIFVMVLGALLLEQVAVQAQSGSAAPGQSAQAQDDQGYGPPCYGPNGGCWGGRGRWMGRGWGGGPWGGPGSRMGRGWRGGPWGGPGGGPGPARGWRAGGPWAWNTKAQADEIGKELKLNEQQKSKLQGILQQPWTIGPRAGVYDNQQRAEAIGKQLNLNSAQTGQLQGLLEKQSAGYGCPGWAALQPPASGGR